MFMNPEGTGGSPRGNSLDWEMKQPSNEHEAEAGPRPCSHSITPPGGGKQDMVRSREQEMERSREELSLRALGDVWVLHAVHTPTLGDPRSPAVIVFVNLI